MTELSVDNLLTKAKNKFLLVNAASARAKQVSDGSLPYIDNFDPTNPVITSLREIAAGKVTTDNIRQFAEKASQQAKAESTTEVEETIS